MKNWIKKAVKVVKDYKEIQEIRKSPDWSPYERQFKRVHGVLVLHDHHALRMHYLIIGAAMLFTDGSKRIVVDDYFFLLDDISQRAVLAHEEGHMVLGHLDTPNIDPTERHQYAARGEVHPTELEADAYAASKVGVEDVVHMLTELCTLPGITPASEKELHNRMFHLLLNQ